MPVVLVVQAALAAMAADDGVRTRARCNSP
jgi:hypothetical protein